MSISYLRRGNGEPIVFLHGLGGGAVSFARQLEELGSEFDCIAWDAPGYGDSSPLEPATFAEFARRLRELFDELGLRSAHIVGHSLGGMIAQELVATYPERVQSLILSCTSARFGPSDAEWQRKFIEARLGPIERGMSMEENARQLIPSLMPRADPRDRQLAIDSMARIPVPAYRAAVECIVMFDRRAWLSRIRVPTLLIAAEEDTTAPARTMEKMAESIAGARYVCLSGTGHLANIQNPAAYSGEIRKFIRALAGRVQEQRSPGQTAQP